MFTTSIKRHVVALLSILFFAGYVRAQDTIWEKIYGVGDYEDNYAWEVKITQDGGFVAIGSAYSLLDDIDNVYMFRTDHEGNLLWTKEFGGDEDDDAYSIQVLSDGGFIATGSTSSQGAGEDDVYIIRFDSAGDTLWTKIYGGTAYDYGYSIEVTSDGGYIILGTTRSFGAGNSDMYLIRTDSLGDTLWTRTYDGSGYDYGISLQITSDGGFILAGITTSYGSGNYDVYLVRTDSTGDTLWTKTYGGSANDVAQSVALAPDGGFIIAGGTSSFGAGSEDMYLIRTDSLGDTLWTKTYGGSDSEEASSVQVLPNGTYILTGYTNSYSTGSYVDVYLVHTDSMGDTIWTATYGGNYDDRAASVQVTPEGEYIIAGQSGSFTSDDDYNAYLVLVRSLSLYTPNGGELLRGGTEDTLKFFCSQDFNADHIRLLLSTDGGTTYQDTIIDSLPTTDTTYIWTVSDVNSTTCKIKIQAISSSGTVIDERASFNSFIIDSRPPSAALPSLPENQSFVSTNSVQFVWQHSEDSLSGVDYYEFEYALDSTFTSTPIDTQITDTSITFTLSDTTLTYYWRVRAVDMAGNMSNWSPLWQFTVDMTAPFIDSTTVLQDTADYFGPFQIQSRITDAGILKDAILYYRTSQDTTWIIDTMTYLSDDWYQGTIPGVNPAASVLIEYYIFAEDDAGNTSRDPQTGSYSFTIGVNENKNIPLKHILMAPLYNKNGITFKFGIPEKEYTSLRIYDAGGRQKKVLLNKTLNPGYYSIFLSSNTLRNGVYFIEMKTRAYRRIRKFFIVK